MPTTLQVPVTIVIANDPTLCIYNVNELGLLRHGNFSNKQKVSLQRHCHLYVSETCKKSHVEHIIAWTNQYGIALYFGRQIPQAEFEGYGDFERDIELYVSAKYMGMGDEVLFALSRSLYAYFVKQLRELTKEDMRAVESAVEKISEFHSGRVSEDELMKGIIWAFSIRLQYCTSGDRESCEHAICGYPMLLKAVRKAGGRECVHDHDGNMEDKEHEVFVQRETSGVSLWEIVKRLRELEHQSITEFAEIGKGTVERVSRYRRTDTRYMSAARRRHRAAWGLEP